MKTPILTTSALLLCVLLAACGTDTGEQTQTSTENTTLPATEAETEITDGLPQNLNFEGKELRILSADYTQYQCHTLLCAEQTGDILDDAVYDRNARISERFNITITETSTGTDFGKIPTTVRQNVAAGDDAYDLAGPTDRDAFALALEGNAYAMDELPHVNLDNPWWVQKLNDSLTFGGKSYVAICDSELSVIDATDVILVNKKLETQYNLDVYSLVENGKWTWDKLSEYARMATSDLDNNGKWDENDNYGFVAGMKQIYPLVWVSSGEMVMKKDENDFPVYATGNLEKLADCFDMAYNLAWGDTFWFGRSGQADYTVDSIIDPPLFASDKALFMHTAFGAFSDAYLREMETDFGVVPPPKYNEEQAEYYARNLGSFIHIVPSSCSDTEFVGAMIEALACESMKTVKPTYYDVALKEKYSRDEQTARILDLLMENRIADYSATILISSVVGGFVLNNAKAGKPLQMSDIEKNRSKVEAQIEKFIEMHDNRFTE